LSTGFVLVTIQSMKSAFRIASLAALFLLGLQSVVLTFEQIAAGERPVKKTKAAIIECKGMIDDGLYKSIKRRTQAALEDGAGYLIFKISTYGGLVASADDISKHFILDIGDKAHTVAYVDTEAISAGAMISVSCSDIIMREHTNIGDCAPIVMGQTLEGVEREKTESFIRATFARAAQANGYPETLLKAMVTARLGVYRVKNLTHNKYEFFDADLIPTDANIYDLSNKELVAKKGELLTLTATEAQKYGVARAVVKNIDEALAFLAQRDGVEFIGNPAVYRTNWSEEMVRGLNSPAVTGILFMIGLLGLYIELNAPGVGLPGLVAVICFAVLFGSRFLVDLANWVETAIFAIGVILLLIEIFIIPGFGITGVAGTICIMIGLVGILIKNKPGELPIPRDAVDWYYLRTGAFGLSLGFLGFVVLAWILAKFLPRFEFFRPLMLSPYRPDDSGESKIVMTAPANVPQKKIEVGDVGKVVKKLRPAGTARFEHAVVDVVSDGEFLDIDTIVEIITISGNRVVVRQVKSQEQNR